MRAFLIALLLIAGTAYAEDTHFVTSYVSHPGESLDAFALRIAPNALARSIALDVSGEICGEFYKTETGFAIDAYTIRHPTACSYYRQPGREYAGLTFHTHVWFGGKPTQPRFSDEDYDHPGYMAQGNVVLFQNGRGTSRRVRSQ